MHNIILVHNTCICVYNKYHIPLCEMSVQLCVDEAIPGMRVAFEE